ncbi:C-C motif chemokine 26 [Cricetulus griseus]|uniref:C-C motif chemokine 26 n=1 Tax=Cricetulus griseus TaxID=10029 RepID=A0A9J7FZ02_CRIGR|nr:C-C motif chemokine 26 [Cricetulus griseus]XP_027272070.1 C-C motif chemokine 26 [Cricetulus griseus]
MKTFSLSPIVLLAFFLSVHLGTVTHILTTKRGKKKICVQPQAKWVQRYISMLKAHKRAGGFAQGSLN